MNIIYKMLNTIPDKFLSAFVYCNVLSLSDCYSLTKPLVVQNIEENDSIFNVKGWP